MSVFIDSAWIEPSSMRGWTAARTSRCWSIRVRPANCGARTVARRWSPEPVSSTTSTSAPGSAASIIRLTSARSATRRSARHRVAAASRLEHLVDADELDPRATERLAALLLGAVDRLPARVGDVLRNALREPALHRGGIGRLARKPPASRSASRLSTVSWASFLFVPMTPEGPRLIQPTAYWPVTCRPLSGSLTLPPSLGITPPRSSNGMPSRPTPL